MTSLPPNRPLTKKGVATRDRIVGVAAELIHEQGMQRTTNDDVRRAAGISGSQLSHYFADKESLVQAVVAWRGQQVVQLTAVAPSGRLDSIQSLRTWADFYLQLENGWQGGCRFGSLAGEILKSELGVKADVATGFAAWEAAIHEGLTTMHDRGELRVEADPRQLTYLLLAAYQGGMLLSQAEQSIEPLRAALGAAIDHIASFQTTAE